MNGPTRGEIPNPHATAPPDMALPNGRHNARAVSANPSQASGAAARSLSRHDEQARVKKQEMAVRFDRIRVGEPAHIVFDELLALAFVERVQERPQGAAAEPID